MTGYLYHTKEDRDEMLSRIGVDSMDQLIDAQVPQSVQLDRPLAIGDAVDEMTLEARLREMASRNQSASSHLCFMGCGAYDHFIPAVVDEIASRGEFYTSYTPYQAEVSQGNLQAMFEYESLMAQLTGLDVSNASLYDGGSATTEAVLMALAACRNRNKVVTSGVVHPEYLQILGTYLENIGAELVTVDPDSSGASSKIVEAIDDQTACVLIQHPNFFGRLEDVAAISSAARTAGAVTVQVFDPISLGVLRRPGDLGVDIAVAEGQSLGNPLAFGGPYLGVMACRQSLVRRIPGRVAGQTTDRRGKRCWVLTLQTREQHIRREKATSNICSNQTLLALRATVYLSLLGPHGLKETAEHCITKANYARQQLAQCDRFEVDLSHPIFKEFVVRDRIGQVDQLLKSCASKGILAGVPLGKFDPSMADCFSVAVTEKRTRQEIDLLVSALVEASAHVTV